MLAKSVPGLLYFFLVLIILARAGEGLEAPSISVTTAPRETISLEFSTEKSAEKARLDLLDIQSNKIRDQQLRSISVTGYASLLNLTQLNDALHQLSSPLDTFRYSMNVPIPLETIQAIEKRHHACRIHYNIPFSYWDPFDSRAPSVQSGVEPSHEQRHKLRRQILGSPNLYSVQATLLYGPEDNYEDLNLVHDILTSCSNIRELALSFDHHGCVVASYPYAFNFKKNAESFPPLEVLKLSGYDMYAQVDGERTQHYRPLSADWGDSWIGDVLRVFERAATTFKKHRNSSGKATDSAVPDDNLQSWLNRMEWSQIRHLELSSATPEILGRLSPVLSNLERFVTHSSTAADAAIYPVFLQNLSNPLKHLTLADVRTSNFSDILGALSSSAKDIVSLELPENEASREYCSSYGWGDDCGQQAFLTEAQLQALAKNNPRISHLGIAIPRLVKDVTNHATWSVDYAAMKAAALQPNLTSLDLYLESPDSYFLRVGGSDNDFYYESPNSMRDYGRFFYQDPTFNRTTMPMLFTEFNQLRFSQGLRPLQKLTVIVGRWEERNDDGGMLGLPIRLVGHWTCTKDLESDMPSCVGGNERMGSDSYLLPDEFYSKDWSEPDDIHDIHELMSMRAM